MRFKRQARPEAFEWTPRKLATAQAKPARERARIAAAYPLLADVLPVPAAVDLETEAERRQRSIDRSDATLRALASRVWRESRRDYFAATDRQRASIRAAWLAWRGPTTFLYFRYLVDLHTGVIEARAQAVRLAEKRRRELVPERLTQNPLDLA